MPLSVHFSLSPGSISTSVEPCGVLPKIFFSILILTAIVCSIPWPSYNQDHNHKYNYNHEQTPHQPPTNEAKMLPLLLSLASKVFSNRHRQQQPALGTHTPKRSRSCTIALPTLLAGLAVILSGIALLLSVLCVFAGHTPSFMQDHALFTLNVSRIGENIRQDLDGRILGVHLKRRDADDFVFSATTIPVASMVMPAPRGLESKISSLETAASSKAHSAASVVHSDIASAATAIASHATSALGAAETDIVNLVDKAYAGLIADLHLKSFYSVHILTTCTGTYQFANGTNVTTGESGLPGPGSASIHAHVDDCSKHSDFNPISALPVLYWVGIVCSAAIFLAGIVGLVRTSKKMACINLIASIPAILFLGLASAVSHGLAIGAAKLINFVGPRRRDRGVRRREIPLAVLGYDGLTHGQCGDLGYRLLPGWAEPSGSCDAYVGAGLGVWGVEEEDGWEAGSHERGGVAADYFAAGGDEGARSRWG